MHNVSVKEAHTVLLINDYMKLPKSKLLAFLAEHGYTGAVVSNDSKRKKALREIIENKGE